MKGLATIIAMALAISPLATRAAPLKIGPTTALNGTGGSITYYLGTATITSTKANSSDSVSALGFDPGRLRFGVVAVNIGGAPANLGYENVVVLGGDNLPVRAHEYDELVRSVEGQTRRRRALIAIGAGLQTFSNQMDANNFSSGSVGGMPFSMNTYNPAVTSALDNATKDRAEARAKDLANAEAAAISGLDGRILRTTTIQPRQIFGGEVVVDAPKLTDDIVPTQITVRVTFADDVHDFRFDLRYAQPR